MGEFNIEEYFKVRIQGQTEQMDTEAIWRALDLDNDERKRGVYFWMNKILPMLLLMVIAIGAWFYFSGIGSTENTESIRMESSKVISLNESEQPSSAQSKNLIEKKESIAATSSINSRNTVTSSSIITRKTLNENSSNKKILRIFFAYEADL